MKKILSGIICILALACAAPSFAQDHADVVRQVAAVHPPAKTVDGAFQFTLEVLAALTAQFPQERAGLLEKVLGDNIVPYNGTLVSAGRIAYPNQHSIKLLSDVPTTNNPEWVDEGPVSLGGFMKGYLAVPIATPAPSPAPIVVTMPPAPIFDTTALDQAIANLRADVDAHRQEFQDFRTEVHNWKAQLGEFVTKYILPELATILTTLKLTGKM